MNLLNFSCVSSHYTCKKRFLYHSFIVTEAPKCQYLKLLLIFDLVDILKSSIFENGQCSPLVLLFFSALNSFASLASTSQFFLPTFYYLTTWIWSRSYINYSLPETFSVETIAPEIKPRFKYRYIRWRNKLRPNRPPARPKIFLWSPKNGKMPWNERHRFCRSLCHELVFLETWSSLNQSVKH